MSIYQRGDYSAVKVNIRPLSVSVHVCVALLTQRGSPHSRAVNSPEASKHHTNLGWLLSCFPTNLVCFGHRSDDCSLGVFPGAGRLLTISLNMSVNNRLTAQWWYYHSRDVELSPWPRGRENRRTSNNLISRSFFWFCVPGRNCQTTPDIHRFWQVQIFRREASAAVIYWNRRFTFSGSILCFEQGFARTRTVKYLTCMQLTIWPLYSPPIHSLPPSPLTHPSYSCSAVMTLPLGSYSKPHFSMQPRFMLQVYTVHGVFFMQQPLLRLVRADFKRGALKLSAIWGAAMNVSAFATYWNGQGELHCDQLFGCSIQA